MGSGRRHTGWILALTGLGLAFGLGWMVGRGGGESTTSGKGVAAEGGRDGGLRPEDVELRLDAGGLTLMPDGGLELPEMEPLGGGPANEDVESTQSP